MFLNYFGLKSKMIEEIKDGKQLLAVIVQDMPYKEEVRFVTPPSLAIQLGLNNRPQGTKIPPHAHFPVKELKGIDSAEIFFVKKGKVKISLYDSAHKKIKDAFLIPGDIIYMLCGHAFEFLEDTQLIEVKQGPYRSREEDKYDLK